MRTQTGLIFYWPDTKLTNTGYITNSTAICNYPVQSLATAEIVPVAVTYLWAYMKALKLQSFLTSTVHDSAIGEVELSEREVVQTIYRKSFCEDVYNYLDKVFNIKFTVPLAVDTNISDNWSVKDSKKQENV